MSKIALITGAANGIGLEFAKIVAAKGYDLVLVDINEAGLKSLSEEIRSKFGVQTFYKQQDLSQPEAATNIKSFLDEEGLKVEILFNNAGFGNFGYFHETNWAKDQAMLNVHMVTSTQLMKLLVPSMIDQGYGRILNNASVAAFVPGPLMSTYHASKAYLLYFGTALNDELKGTGVTVTTLCPGMTKTGFAKANGNQDPDIKFNIASPYEVALFGFQKMQKGQSLAIPGFFNKLSTFLPRFLPRRTVAKMVGNIQRKNHTKRMADVSTEVSTEASVLSK